MLHSAIITMAATAVILFDSFAHSFSLRPPVGVYKQLQHQQRFLSRIAAKGSAVHAQNDDNDSNENDTVETPPLESRQGIASLEEDQDEDEILGYAIDSFLRGDYNQQFADDAPSPRPGLSPGATVEAGLRSLRDLNSPHPSHGAAVLLRFCLPLTRSERWGDASRLFRDPWKEILRGSLTPSMLARRLRASPEFSGLLDWVKLDVTEGAAYATTAEPGSFPSRAFVNAALFFGDGMEPSLIQLTLRRVGGGVWLIDTARRSQRELFIDAAPAEDN